jgi:hypothetical protein
MTEGRPLQPRLTFSPRANTASPAALMFLAALVSRSQSVLHSGHSQDRTSSGSDSCVYPQSEQRLELGKNGAILTSCLPAHSALYSSCRISSPQEASAICFDRQGLRIMFFTRSVSTQTTWFSLISRGTACASCPCGNRRFWREYEPPLLLPWHDWPNRVSFGSGSVAL